MWWGEVEGEGEGWAGLATPLPLLLLLEVRGEVMEQHHRLKMVS